MISNAVCSFWAIHNWKFQIPSTNIQRSSKLQRPKQVTRLMFGALFIDPAVAGLELGFWNLELHLGTLREGGPS
jgi:hypothetical protein